MTSERGLVGRLAYPFHQETNATVSKETLSPVVEVAICFLLRSLFSSSLRLLAISAGERGVSLNTEVDAEEAEEVEGDGDIMGDKEFCCRLSMASYRSRLLGREDR